ncbi:putative DMBT1-like protein isoform X3 [Salvelinus alpinus]|uniref:putative DMBT1-like protein isoform X3 n=1 Tax=Salvelinus alpinus TaxID=8036 RepID=UPI0039FBD27E
MVTKMLHILLVLTTLGADGESLRIVPAADGFSFIRLVHGDSDCAGRVELLQGNQWGTVCDEGWDLKDADVLCKELGCGLADKAIRRAAFGRGTGEIWLSHVQCSGHEASLTRCPRVLHSPRAVNGNPICTHDNDAGVKCSGALLMPTLSLLSPHAVLSPGEAVRFSCTVVPGHHLNYFNLSTRGIDTPLMTRWVTFAQSRVEFTLSILKTTQQGSYSCLYGIKGISPSSSTLTSPPSNFINITVVELLTPLHWYNTSTEAPTGSVIKGHSFNITCFTEKQYPGGSFQLRLIRSNDTVHQSLPALTPAVTFSFSNAQLSNEGYYYCLYMVQLDGRTFVSRESQPLPVSIRGADGESLRIVPAADGFSFIRLVHGDSDCAGRVELLQGNQWGTVCDEGWDLKDADVLCKELGCGLADKAIRRAAFGRGTGEIWLSHVQCSGHEASLTRCPRVLHSPRAVNGNPICTHDNDAGVKCSGALLMPTLSLLSPHAVLSPGEAVRFSCTVVPGHHLNYFNLSTRGIDTPLMTRWVTFAQSRVEFTLSILKTTQQGSYSCLYGIKGISPSSSTLTSPPSNFINITVVELLTPLHWYNTSTEAPTGSVIKGHSFNITCFTEKQYPGGSFQLRLIRSNDTVHQSLPALTPAVTFSFSNAQLSNEGYYYCLYMVQLDGRTFVSRESQPLPVSIRGADGESLRIVPAADGFSFIRLVHGDSDCAGRVELLQGNQWGTVCDEGWDLKDADVLCKELGCGLADKAIRRAAFGRGTGEIWLSHVQCSGHEASLTRCPRVLHSPRAVNGNPICTHDNDAGVKCSGALLMPTLSLLSPHAVLSPGEAVRFSCTVVPGHHLNYFNLSTRGIDTPLMTRWVTFAQSRVEFTLSILKTTQQGSYSCLYGIKGISPSSSTLTSPPSNFINITVVELLTPLHWYNTSTEAPTGSVIKGHSFNITCFTEKQYPGGSFQLRLIRSNDTVHQSLPALTPAVTFSFSNAQLSNEGYYYCLYMVQLDGRTFVSRESQPLPVSIRDPDPVLSPMVISCLASALAFLVALVVVVVIIIVARVKLCKRQENPLALELETRTCVDNTYVALG